VCEYGDNEVNIRWKIKREYGGITGGIGWQNEENETGALRE
jgi:hypothetical protein